MKDEPDNELVEKVDIQRSILFGNTWKPEPPAAKNESEVGHQSETKVADTHFNTTPSATATVNESLSIERRQYLEHHLKSRPTDLDAYLELAQLYRDDNRPADARRVLKLATQVFPENPTVLWELEEAVLARSLQQYREVLEIAKRLETPELDREIERSENDWACRRIEVCESRLKRDPKMHDLRLAMGEAFFDVGRFQEAIESVQSLEHEDSFSASAWFLKGRCLLEIGKNQEAMAALRAVALRRAVPAPIKLKTAALKLLCVTAERLGVPRSLELYRQQLKSSELELHQTE